MAGAGYKLFNTGDVLTAAQVNTYLMEQTVMRFATTTARDTALSGVLAEGMLCYIDADNNIYKYTGSAWVNIDTTGGGSPLTTKGDLYTYSTTDARLAVGNNGETLVADSSTATGLKWQADTVNTVVDAKGDLLVGTAADTLSRLAVGTNGYTLQADSSTATGLKWAAAASGASFVGVEVYASANQSTSNAVDFYRPFNTENWDTDGFHSTTTNTERLTVPSGQAGKYWVYANQGHAAFSTGYASYVFSVNRTLEVGRVYVRPYSSQAMIIFLGIVLDLAVGDYVELDAIQTSGGSLDVLGGRGISTFGMYKIG